MRSDARGIVGCIGFFFSSRRRHTRCSRDWSSDVCSSDLQQAVEVGRKLEPQALLHEYDEVAPYLILSQNPLVAERYVSHVLRPLLQADAKAALMETLEALMTRGSVKGAAAALQLHRHTVLYRMEKLRE